MSYTIIKDYSNSPTPKIQLKNELTNIPNITDQFFGKLKDDIESDGFKLDDSFIQSYRTKKPKFGFNGLGELVFFRTYSRLKPDNTKETFADTVQRVVEGCYEIQRRHCRRLHIPWDYDKALESAHEMYERIWDFKFTPPGRGMWMMGTKFMWERGSAALNNCFNGQTEIITRNGIKKIGDLAGTTQRLLSKGGKWIDSKISSFGQQEIYRLVVRRGRHRKIINTTINHRWFIKSKCPKLVVAWGEPDTNQNRYKTRECVTSELRKGMRLCANYGSGINNQMLRPSIVGIMHGVCCGDGTTGSPNPAHGTYLYLCGKKDSELLKYFSAEFHITDAPERGSEGSKRIADLPRFFRQLPDLSEASTYLYGWLSGYFAADGRITKKGTVQICSSSITNLEHVASVCAILGIGCHQITSGLQTVKYQDGTIKKFVGYQITLFSDHLNTDFFLLSHHKTRYATIKQNRKKSIPAYNYWYVDSVETTGSFEEVYCPQVPDYHCFTLAGNILTGNCGFVSTNNIHESDPAEPFCFLMDMSMLGVGVGFDTKGAGKIRIHKPYDRARVYKVPDSREGWVDSLRYLIHSYTTHFEDGYIEFDYSGIRPAGSDISGFGGKASGPSILQELHLLVRRHLNRKINSTLSSVDITDLMNYIGKCVVAGNVRRTAEIAFGEADDHEYQSMKNYKNTLIADDIPKFDAVTARLWKEAQAISKDTIPVGTPADFAKTDIPEERLIPAIDTWNAMNNHRWASNNSIFARVGMDYTEVSKQIATNGEPGLIWLDNIRDYGRYNDGRQPGIDGRVMGSNPCVEQSLESYELCVSGNTRLQTKHGCPRISDVVGSSIEIWNGDSWSVVKPRITGTNRKLYRVHLSDGSYLDTTENHGWSVKRSRYRIYRRVETQHLPIGFQVQPFSLDVVAGEEESSAFELGYVTGDGYLDLIDRPQYTRAMAVACGSKIKLKNLGMKGTWYKPQIRKGYAEPYNRINLEKHVTVEQTKQLRDKMSGLPDWVFAWNRDSILQYVAGWIESDGCVCVQENTHGYRIYGTEAKIRDAQLLVRRIGINHSSVNFCHPAGQITNKGIRKHDLYYLQIPSYECAEIPTRVKQAIKIGSRYKKNPKGKNDLRYMNSLIDMAKKQHIEYVEELPGLHTTYCFDESQNHMGVFGNAITYQCNLVESFPANHVDANDYMRTLKFAYLYAKTVTLLPTHNPRTNQVTLRNRRIGLSQSGIVQAYSRFGRRAVLRDFCDAGYNEIRRWDSIYAEWLCVQRSIKVTSVKPSGTVSLLVGATPGIHYPESKTYWRRVRLAKSSVLVQILTDAGYHIEPVLSDPERTVVVKFAINDDRVRAVSEVTMWEQMSNVIDYQRYWADNQVSCTIKFSKTEKDEIKNILEIYEDQLKSVSFLPMEDHGYAQAPYEPCTPEEVEEYNSKLKPADYSAYIMEAAGSYFCDNDKCEIPAK